jgi:DNA-binding NarL/FixJ family response regulator
MMKRPRILLADDHVLIADALKSLLAPNYDVVGIVSDGRALLVEAEKLKPDLIVVDIGMPQLNGLDATRQIKRLMPKVKVIILTMNEDNTLVAEAFRAGATGYLLKHSASQELLQAIREVLRGSSYLSPRITSGAVASMLRGGNPKVEEAHELTPRQREVIQLLAEGRSMKEIADLLTISLRTVAAHKYRIMELLDITNNADLYRYAVKHQIVTL